MKVLNVMDIIQSLKECYEFDINIKTNNALLISGAIIATLLLNLSISFVRYNVSIPLYLFILACSVFLSCVIFIKSNNKSIKNVSLVLAIILLSLNMIIVIWTNLSLRNVGEFYSLTMGILFTALIAIFYWIKGDIKISYKQNHPLIKDVQRVVNIRIRQFSLLLFILTLGIGLYYIIGTVLYHGIIVCVLAFIPFGVWISRYLNKNEYLDHLDFTKDAIISLFSFAFLELINYLLWVFLISKHISASDYSIGVTSILDIPPIILFIKFVLATIAFAIFQVLIINEAFKIFGLLYLQYKVKVKKQKATVNYDLNYFLSNVYMLYLAIFLLFWLYFGFIATAILGLIVYLYHSTIKQKETQFEINIAEDDIKKKDIIQFLRVNQRKLWRIFLPTFLMLQIIAHLQGFDIVLQLAKFWM